MTPDQRMEFMSRLANWADAPSHRAAMNQAQELISFVENLEFKAHIAGQMMERENHQEFYVNCEPRTTEV